MNFQENLFGSILWIYDGATVPLICGYVYQCIIIDTRNRGDLLLYLLRQCMVYSCHFSFNPISRITVAVGLIGLSSLCCGSPIYAVARQIVLAQFHYHLQFWSEE